MIQEAAYQTGSTPVEIIAAIGAVCSSLFTLYLVHRRVSADRLDRQHRADEDKVYSVLLEKMGLDIELLKEEKVDRQKH